MSSIYDLTLDLIEEILSRVPMTSLGAIRSTCKLWNTMSKDPSFKLCVKAAANDIMLITWHDFKPCLMSVNLHNHQDLVDPFIKQIGKIKQVDIEIVKLFYCNGLLLCVAYEHKESSLVVWNPYTGQTRWIKPYCGSSLYGMGYDSNNHHKILRIPYDWVDKSTGYEIYDFKTKSWRVLDVSIDWHVYAGQGVSLKGNNYFLARCGVGEEALKNCLLCFDFTRERFWSVPLPFSSPSEEDSVILSAVGEEKLAVLSSRRDTLVMEIWITNRIHEPNVVSWSCFLKVDKLPINRFMCLHGSFFVDEKKKVAVISCINLTTDVRNNACMVGEGGHYREVDLGETFKYSADMRNNELDTADKRRLQRIYGPFIFSSYVPNSVQIQ